LSIQQKDLRQYFPILAKPSAKDWVYFDSAATSLKLQSVIDVTQSYYQRNTANVHRSSHKMAADITEKFEKARVMVQHFIGAKSPKEIIWTKGATESINLLAGSLSKSLWWFKPGDEIVIACTEHHSNIVPWQQITQQLGLKLKVMPIDDEGKLLVDDALSLIGQHTALVAVAHVSNALGNINPIQHIINKAKSVGALTVIDGTQAVAHMPVNVTSLDCDFYVFSGHKMFGPTGIGVLYGKQHLLEQLPPYQFGGEMVKTVDFEQTKFQDLPLKFEAGTPNIAGVLGFAAAAEFIQQHFDIITLTEVELHAGLIQLLSDIPQVKLWGDNINSICIQSFTVNGIDPYDLAVLLDKNNIAVRVGHHCAMPLMKALNIDGTVRVSLACYNTLEEITQFGLILRQAIISLLDTQSLLSSSEPKTINDDHRVNTTFGPIAQDIISAKSWDDNYRQLMLAGKRLNRLPDVEKTIDTEVVGCESQVWLVCSLENQQLVLRGDSPSKIVRGLLAVVFEVFDSQSPVFVLNFKLTEYLRSLGLDRHLSQSRGNGLGAVVEKISQFCGSQSA
jgi:cysteine desulfurase/selenocysteine lyase